MSDFCRECEKPMEADEGEVTILLRSKGTYVIHVWCLPSLIARTNDPEDQAILKALYTKWMNSK